MRTNSAGPPASLVLLLAQLIVAACGGASGSTFVPGSGAFPSSGSIHIVGDPPSAESALSVRYLGADGNASAVSDEFEVGDLLVIDRATFPGQYSVIVNEEVCDGPFEVVSGQETDLTLRVAARGCAAVVIGMHVETEGFHDEVFAIVSGLVPIGATVSLVSLDDPPRIEPVTLEADESGVFQVDRLPPGRYRLDVSLTGKRIGTATLDLEAGQAEHLELPTSPLAPSAG